MNSTIRTRLEHLELRNEYEALLKKTEADKEMQRGYNLLANDPEGRRLIARTFERMHELLRGE